MERGYGGHPIQCDYASGGKSVDDDDEVGGCLFPAGADLLLCIEYAFVAFDSFYDKENDAYVLLVGTKFRKGAGSYAKQLDR